MEASIAHATIETPSKLPATYFKTPATIKATPSQNSKRNAENLIDYRSLLENNSTDLIMMANQDGQFIYGSPSVHKSLGYSEMEYLHKSVFTVVHPESVETAQALLQDVLTYPGKMFTIHLMLQHKNGTPMWVEGLAINLLHQPGVNALVGNFRNINERKKIEQQIKESGDLYRNLFNKNPVPIGVCEITSLKFLEVNEAAIRHYGYTRKEFLKMTFFGVAPQEEHNTLKQLLEDACHKKNSGILKTHIKKNKEIIFVDLLVHSISYKGMPCYLILANDITEKVQLQSQLLEEKIQWQKDITKATIDAQEKEREEIGRELHDNITQILTTASLCLSYAAENFSTQDEMIQRSKTNITNAIEEIRTLSRSMVQSFHREVGLKLSIEDLIESIKMANFRVALNFNLPDEHILDDKLKTTLFRIVQEQLNNILKHAKASRVVISVKEIINTLHLTITDNGKGFNTAVKRKGIGITNIINRAELFNGHAKIISSPGNGCGLEVTFPLC
jgi:PAS domain S-box-containing protein